MDEKISKESVKQPFWALPVEETLKILGTGLDGLSDEETKKRAKIFGPNSIKEYRRLGRLSILLGQLKSPLIFALIITGGITVFLQEWVDAAVIFGAVAVNAVLGFWQENKAEEVLELLKSYVRVKARVRRQGLERELEASELVPGDIIRLNGGARVPADARIIFSNNLEADESILTGESLPEAKSPSILPPNAPLAERTSMLYSGTLIVRGLADAIVTATAYDTEFGKIALLLGEEKRDATPLQKTIGDFTVKAGGFLVLLIMAMFALGLYLGQNLYEMFLIAVAAAVSAVPEGLPVALTVILAIGVRRLAAKGGVIRKLLAAETLGSTTVILTDKTGTLTEAKMELDGVFPYGSVAKTETLKIALINTDVIIENGNTMLGNPVDVAIVKAAKKDGIEVKNIKILERLLFSSETKFAASIYEEDSAKKIALLGAPEIILKHTRLSPEEQAGILLELEKIAYAGKRVLGVCRGKGDKIENLDFLGLIALSDPIRQSAKEALRQVGLAGIRTVIVTGDHKGTAEAVARELGLVDGKGAILTGEDMLHFSPSELKNRLFATSVFARVTPEDKVRLVRAFKAEGEIVAVTGDGINDAPALKMADIGVAIGSGTDVAKSASDLILVDNDFATLVAAIEEGKRILGNVRKVIVYLLSDSLDELFLIGGAILAGLELPISALQILFVNFFSDSFPALALAFEESIDGWGDKGGGRKIFDKKVKFLILGIGFLTSALLFTLYFILLKMGFEINLIKTFIFAAFATYTLFLSFSIRSLERGLFSYNPFANKYLVGGVAVGLVLTASAVYIPFLQKVFHTTPLPVEWLLGVLAVGIFNIILVELSKWFFRKKAL